jgi:RNA-directed DNA polymerase
MADEPAAMSTHTEDWRALSWSTIERNVFRLQKRIYRATARGDFKQVHNLQRLLLRSWSGRCLATRRVTQDNRGKNTPGIDGIARVAPSQRMVMVHALRNNKQRAHPIRRVYIPKRNSDEKRPLGIPVMFDRAQQALVKLALEPEWEQRFEANSYGFRPGRGAHDAIEAIFKHISQRPKYVLDADIEKCFDRINHEGLLAKLTTLPQISRLVKGWLKAGILENGNILFPEQGTPQGGVISPLLANIALHGLETALMEGLPHGQQPGVVRYADDFVILHPNLDTLQQLKQKTEEWLAGMGLRLKPSKTRITHTLTEYDGEVGFDFLGFTIRQYPVGKHRTRTYRKSPGHKTLIKPSKTGQLRHMQEIAATIKQHQNSTQTVLIGALNGKMRGWAMYYRTCVAKAVFAKLDDEVYWKLRSWAHHRHHSKGQRWQQARYWQHVQGRNEFTDGHRRLYHYADTPVRRHTKIQGQRSPFDGDWTYWIPRLGKDPSKPEKVVKLLKHQQGRCPHCRLYFTTTDHLEIHHKDGVHANNMLVNLELLHGHCHDEIHQPQYP